MSNARRSVLRPSGLHDVVTVCYWQQALRILGLHDTVTLCLWLGCIRQSRAGQGLKADPQRTRDNDEPILLPLEIT
jgi:hypothetical protein